MKIDWPKVGESFRGAWTEIVAFRGAHPTTAALAIGFFGGWLVAFCTFH